MKQAALNRNFSVSAKKSRWQVLLEQIEQVVPWDVLVELIAPHYPEDKIGSPSFPLHTMLRVHFPQQWFNRADLAMEETFFDIPMCREFAQWQEFGRRPDEDAVKPFRHRLEKHKLAQQILTTAKDLLISKGLLLKVGIVVDATLIAAPSSTKINDKARDPDLHTIEKGEQMYFAMKTRVGADAESGLVHPELGSSGDVYDVTQGNSLLRDEEMLVFSDAGYQAIRKHADAKRTVTWHRAIRLGKRRLLYKDNGADVANNKAEKLKSGVRAKVKSPFRVIKRQFGGVKVCYWGLKKNMAQLIALSDPWMVRGKFMGAAA